MTILLEIILILIGAALAMSLLVVMFLYYMHIKVTKIERAEEKFRESAAFLYNNDIHELKIRRI